MGEGPVRTFNVDFVTTISHSKNLQCCQFLYPLRNVIVHSCGMKPVTKFLVWVWGVRLSTVMNLLHVKMFKVVGVWRFENCRCLKMIRAIYVECSVMLATCGIVEWAKSKRIITLMQLALCLNFWDINFYNFRLTAPYSGSGSHSTNHWTLEMVGDLCMGN